MARVRKTRVKKGADPFRQQRQAYTEQERKALRRHAEQHKHLNQKELALWFFHRFKKKIPQSTVSESLSDKFAHVDGLNFKEKDVVYCRSRTGKYPELDRVLFEFQQFSRRQRCLLPAIFSKLLLSDFGTSFPLQKTSLSLHFQ